MAEYQSSPAGLPLRGRCSRSSSSWRRLTASSATWSTRDAGKAREPHVERKQTNNPPESDKLCCPSCPRTMRLVGQETSQHSRSSPPAELLTFQCDCGQMLTTMTNQ